METPLTLDPTAEPRWARASVQVGPLETPYARAGRGPAVLVLGGGGSPVESSPGPAPEWVELARSFRVVVPLVPAGVPPVGWLGDLVQGLGLEGAVVVVWGEPLRARLTAELEAAEAVLGGVLAAEDGEDPAALRLRLQEVFGAGSAAAAPEH